MKNFKALLTKPNPDSKLWCFWIWNKRLSEFGLRQQLYDIIQKGFKGIAIRPSRDMVPSFLSEEFFHLFELILSICKNEGLSVKIADDFSLPWSGFFQKYAEQQKGFRAQRLVLENSFILAIKEIFEYEIPEKDSYIILASKIQNNKIVPSSIKNLTVGIKGQSISWKIPVGEWKIMIFKKEYYVDPLGYFIPNVFNPKVAQIYTQEILEKYTTLFGKYIPAPFEGFICEMPTCLPSKHGIPWDDDLIIKYKSRYKKSLIDVLPSLFFEVEDVYAKYRSHIYMFIIQSMYERFPSILEGWAKKHRLSQWVLCPERDTLNGENSLRDITAVISTDMASCGIQNQDGTDQNFPILNAISNINNNEFKRETIGVIGRNRQGSSNTLQQLKKEIDKHFILETNKLIIDGCYFNIDPRSYIKTPFNVGWFNPEWNQFKRLSDYVARMDSILHDMVRLCPVAVVMPASSLMADYLVSNDEEFKNGISLFKQVVEYLSAHSIQFDIISEQYLLTCTIKPNGEFGTVARKRKSPYQVLIYPYSRYINNSIFVFLEKLAQKNGTIIFINEAPVGNFDDGQNASFSSRVSKLIRSKNENVHVVPVSELLSKLEPVEKPINITINGKPCNDIISSCMYGQGYVLYLLHNNSSVKDCFATIEIPEVNNVYLIDCTEEEIYPIDGVQNQDQLSIFELDFSPDQTFLVLGSSVKLAGTEVKNEKLNLLNTIGNIARNYRVVLKDKWTFSTQGLNAMPLANWALKIGINREVGNFFHLYEGFFEIEELPQICMLAISDGNLLEFRDGKVESPIDLSINGTPIKPSIDTNFLLAPESSASLEIQDYMTSFLNCTVRYNIKDLCIKGINRISLRAPSNITNAKSMLYPPIILGNFAIIKGARGWLMTQPKREANYGSWTKHGYPYYSGIGTYEQVFEIPTEFEHLVLRFNNVSGYISAKLNDKQLGMMLWQPMGFDITSFIEPRRNVLKVNVLNSFDNLLKMNNRPSGLTGEVYLDVY